MTPKIKEKRGRKIANANITKELIITRRMKNI